MVTKRIKHGADSVNLKDVTLKIFCSSLTEKCFEMPNASYTNRYV